MIETLNGLSEKGVTLYSGNRDTDDYTKVKWISSYTVKFQGKGWRKNVFKGCYIVIDLSRKTTSLAWWMQGSFCIKIHFFTNIHLHRISTMIEHKVGGGKIE